MQWRIMDVSVICYRGTTSLFLQINAALPGGLGLMVVFVLSIRPSSELISIHSWYVVETGNAKAP